MLAQDNEYLEAAANSLFEANEERMVRERCIARKLAERRERTLERDIKILKENIGTLRESNATLKESNTKLEEQIRELEALLSKRDLQK